MTPGSCPYCDRLYAVATACDYLKRDPMPLPFEAPEGMRCPECNVAPGCAHHPYCERGACGNCGGAFAKCGSTECGGLVA